MSESEGGCFNTCIRCLPVQSAPHHRRIIWRQTSVPRGETAGSPHHGLAAFPARTGLICSAGDQLQHVSALTGLFRLYPPQPTLPPRPPSSSSSSSESNAEMKIPPTSSSSSSQNIPALSFMKLFLVNCNHQTRGRNPRLPRGTALCPRGGQWSRLRRSDQSLRVRSSSTELQGSDMLACHRFLHSAHHREANKEGRRAAPPVGGERAPPLGGATGGKRGASGKLSSCPPITFTDDSK